MSVWQRQKPDSQTPLAQSLPALQRRPRKSGSSVRPLTGCLSKLALALQVAMVSQLGLDGTISSDLKSPSTSATTGFSYQVHEERYCEKSTSPVLPS